jgi:uncharacterized protein
VSTPGTGRSAQLPLFPLGTVLTPGMPLSLHIFEPRYRQLIADLLNERDPQAPEFGVVALRGGWEVGTLQDLYEVGTTARVTDVLPLPDGRCDLSAIGERRFVVEQLDTAVRPYLMATVRWLGEPDGALPAALVPSTRRAMQRHRQALARLDVHYAEPPGSSGQPEAEAAEPDQISAAGTDPAGTDPAGTDPAGADPAGPDSAGTDPAGPDSAGADPAGADSAGTDPAGTDPIAARELSYAVARLSWLPLADRQHLLACPDTAARLRSARAVLRREAVLVSQLRAVPVTTAAFRD